MKTLDLAALQEMGRKLEAPFALQVCDGTRTFELVCHKVLRLLPGRRLVAQVASADVDGVDGVGDAVLKLFWGRGALRYQRRERAGLELLASAGAWVPDTVGVVSVSSRGYGLLLRFVPGAAPVTAANTGGFKQLARLTAVLHDRGVWQSDLNLGNFLLAADGLSAVDGDGVRQRSRALSRRHGLANFARLLAERPPAFDGELDVLLGEYCQSRSWPVDDAMRGRLDQALARQRRQRMIRFAGKTLRNCSEFAVSRSGRKFVASTRSLPIDDLQGFMRDYDQMTAAETLKAGNSATVIRWRPDSGRSLIVKRYNVKSPLHGLRRSLQRRPRATRAWQNGHLLQLLDLPTATPLVLVQRRFGPLRGAAFLLCEDLGSQDLASEVAQQGLSDQRCAQVVDLFTRLKRCGLSHGDTKASNFMIHHNTVHLIDLDAMGLSAMGWRRDVSRFLCNWEGEVRARFERAFRGAGLL